MKSKSFNAVPQFHDLIEIFIGGTQGAQLLLMTSRQRIGGFSPFLLKWVSPSLTLAGVLSGADGR
jgi:hypothetical protein